MAYVKSYRMGLDADGVFHVQAVFESMGPEDTRFKWKTGFVLHKEDGRLRWGIWDGQKVLVDTGHREAILSAISSLLKRCYYMADTVMPETTPGYTEDSVMLILPPVFSERVDLGEGDVSTLRQQEEMVEKTVA